MDRDITERALDTTIAVVTPENIAFEYQLAGPFRRLPAYVIDWFARCAFIVFGFLSVILVMGLSNRSTLSAFAMASAMIGYFLVSWFYGAFFETFFNGRTPGKWYCGIRVIDVDGCPITGTRAVIRNLLRIADMAPLAALATWDEDIPPIFLIPTGMVGLLSVIVTRRMQRLGDLAAGTMVVIDEKLTGPRWVKIDDPRIAALATFLPSDYRVSRTMARTLALYAERRHYLMPGRRREIAKHLAIPLIDRFGFRTDLDGDLLIMALYHRTFLCTDAVEPISSGALAGFYPLRSSLESQTNVVSQTSDPMAL